MLRDLQTKLYDGDVGIAGDRPNPGASARNRYAELFTWMWGENLGGKRWNLANFSDVLKKH